jgi:acyl transferase domain-containing protein
VFLFPGQGAQHVNMTRDLYDEEPAFRAIVDECAVALRAPLDMDLRDLLYPAEANGTTADRLKQTRYAQPALFVVEYALARLWMQWGVKPESLIGHSIGEFVAACLSGVLSLPDALKLVALRGSLMEQMPAGAMLSASRRSGSSFLDASALAGGGECVGGMRRIGRTGRDR